MRSEFSYLAVVGLLISLGADPALADAPPRQNGSTEVPPWLVTFSGIDVAPDSFYIYKGTIISLNRNLDKDGFVLRLFGGYGDYSYDENTVPGGRVDGNVKQFDVMIGYTATLGRVSVGAYVGVDYQNQRLNPPDPQNPVSGSETGLKIAADLETDRERAGPYASVAGNYSTAFDSYWARARVGYNFGKVIFGPEVIASGNEGYNGHRLGAFLSIDTKINRWVPMEITMSVGHQFIHNDDSANGNDAGNGGGSGGGSGTYGALNVIFQF
jgi:Cellulose biosynthesis protein BcsS